MLEKNVRRSAIQHICSNLQPGIGAAGDFFASFGHKRSVEMLNAGRDRCDTQRFDQRCQAPHRKAIKPWNSDLWSFFCQHDYFTIRKN